MIPIGENEKAYVLESKSGGICLCRALSGRYYEFTPDRAIDLAIWVKEIAPEDRDNWVAREVDDAGLEDGWRRLEEIWKNARKKNVGSG